MADISWEFGNEERTYTKNTFLMIISSTKRIHGPTVKIKIEDLILKEKMELRHMEYQHLRTLNKMSLKFLLVVMVGLLLYLTNEIWGMSTMILHGI